MDLCWGQWVYRLRSVDRDGPNRPRAICEEGITFIRDLYAIDAEIRGKDPVASLVGRQERSARILARLDDWLRHHRARASTKSPLGEALAYITKYRDGLGRFMSDGRAEIDNNTVERTSRPIALNRKNAIFAGHDAGAENRAVIASADAGARAFIVWMPASISGDVRAGPQPPHVSSRSQHGRYRCRRA